VVWSFVARNSGRAARVLRVSRAPLVRWRELGRRWRGGTRYHLFCFTGQFAAHPSEGLDEFDARALGSDSAENRFGVLEPGMRTKRHVTKAQDRKQADAGFEATTSKDSEHHHSLGRVARGGEVLGGTACWTGGGSTAPLGRGRRNKPHCVARASLIQGLVKRLIAVCARHCRGGDSRLRFVDSRLDRIADTARHRVTRDANNLRELIERSADVKLDAASNEFVQVGIV
jgi:hypothetical protein